MKSLGDAWHLHRGTLPRAGLDARARAEIERAFFAGAQYAVDSLEDMNAAGLLVPFAISHQLQLWSSEAHAARYTREGNV